MRCMDPEIRGVKRSDIYVWGQESRAESDECDQRGTWRRGRSRWGILNSMPIQIISSWLRSSDIKLIYMVGVIGVCALDCYFL